jgi:RNA recognition motif-containing protein
LWTKANLTIKFSRCRFGKFGKIIRCDVKAGRGFGFVEFEDERDAKDAMRDLDGTFFFFLLSLELFQQQKNSKNHTYIPPCGFYV